MDVYNEKNIKKRLLKRNLFLFENSYSCISFVKQELMSSPVSKLYRREIIESRFLLFDPSLSYGEDRTFNLEYIKYIECAYSISYVGYYYNRDPSNSLSKIKCQNLFLNKYRQWIQLNDFFENKCSRDLFVNEYLVNELYSLINDEIVDNAINLSFIKSYVVSKKIMSYIEHFSLLKENSKLIHSNRLLVYLLINKFLLLILIVYKIRFLYGKTN